MKNKRCCVCNWSFWQRVCYILVLVLIKHAPAYAQDSLVFKNPPVKYGPYVWWHWMGPNFSEEGITKDLEAMKDVGVGGATIFNIASAVEETHVPMLNNPWPEKVYRGEAYWKAVRHAAKEAMRLGIDLGLHNTVGYSTTGGPWISEEQGMQCLVSSKTIIEGGQEVQVRLPQAEPPLYKGRGNFNKKATVYKDIAVIAVPVKESAGESDAMDLSRLMNSEGILSWRAPKGKWIVYRFGYAPTMANPHPVTDDLMGKVLEVDKMNRAHSLWHWKNVLEPLKANVGNYLGKSFRHILIDSYEAGKQTWTDGFRDKFITMKGYDPLPWLTGNIGSAEEKKRFDYDYKDVISSLYYSDGFKVGRDMIHRYGMELYFEPYTGPFNTVECTPLADIPMGEFWTHGSGAIKQDVVSAARACGRNIIAAEAFTSRPERSAWTEDPAFLKKTADGAFCSGVNRLILHHWVHQPFDDCYQPGLSMGWWGTHFSRYQTWFEPGKAFFAYLTRIQYMLQQGEECIDYLCLDKVTGNGDVISSSNLMAYKLKVQDGNLILPSGRSYRFLVCENLSTVTPEVLSVLVRLSKKGLAIVGKRPLKSPSLSGYPDCDRLVEEMGKSIKLFPSIDSVKKHLHLPEIYKTTVSSSDVKVVVRQSGNSKIVFVANRTSKLQKLQLAVLSSDLLPEIWNPEDGGISVADSWKYEKGYTLVDLALQPNQTLFVVLKQQPSELQKRQGLQSQKPLKKVGSVTLNNEWNVVFKPKLEPSFEMFFDRLGNFKYHTDKRIAYFAGTAIYTKKIVLSDEVLDKEDILLSLGDMADIASVSVNGHDAGVWWYPPYVKSIKQYLKSGENVIEISVTTNWANRLIGDEQEPADFEWGSDRGKLGRAMKAYPDWFISGKQRPSKRKAFVIWYYHRANSALQSAGLMGPVELELCD